MHARVARDSLRVSNINGQMLPVLTMYNSDIPDVKSLFYICRAERTTRARSARCLARQCTAATRSTLGRILLLPVVHRAALARVTRA